MIYTIVPLFSDMISFFIHITAALKIVIDVVTLMLEDHGCSCCLNLEVITFRIAG